MTEKTETPTVEPEISPETPPEPKPSEDEGLEFEEVDFSAITEFVESDGEVKEPPVEPPAEVQATPAEEIPPEEPAVEVKPSETPPPPEGEEKPPEVEAPAEEKELPAKEPEPEPEPEPVQEPVKVPTREELEGMYAEHREKTLPQLTELFTLTDEEAAALDEKPSEIIPQLAGKMMYDTMLSTYNAVMSAMPTVVQTYLAASRKAEKAKGQFYDAWPALNNAKSSKAVQSAIQAYRGANPRSELKDIIKGAGVMAMINLGLDPLVKETKEVTPPKAPAPAAPVSPGGVPPTPPVKPGGEEENEFSELARIFDEEHA